MIFIAGLSIALFISALILTKKNKSKSDLFLFFWMILNAVQLAFYYLFYTNEIYNFPHLLGFQFPLPLLNGVLLYYYVASVTNQFPKKKGIILSHLVPTLITAIYIIPFMLLPIEQKIAVFKNDGKGYENFMQLLLLAIFLSGTSYVIWSGILLRRHKKRIKNQFSDIEDISLLWLQFLTYGLGVVWFFVIVTQNDAFIYTGVSVFVILIGFFGVQQKNIFINKPKEAIVQTLAAEISEPVKKKYESSGLSKELADKLYAELSELMTANKPYKNCDLSLSDLAKELNIHSNYLSQVINEKEGKNFYDYVNEFRIDEFKRLIVIPENHQFTLIALAYDCGFNSKSSFNRYFKKITGETPSQYAKKYTP